MIVVCGEALIDLVPADAADTWRAVPGGGPANTALAAARLGTRAALACRLSGDAFGRRLRRHLAGNGVDLSLAVPAAEPTTIAVVSLDEQGAAEYRFYANGTADWQWTPAELPASLPPGTAGVHVGSLASVLPPGAGVLRAWAAGLPPEVTVVYDVNVRPALLPGREEYRTRVEEWLKVAHLVKASDEDLRWLYPGSDPLRVARSWAGRDGVHTVLVTLGAEGAVAVSSAFGPAAGEPIRVPGIAVEVADTVGAGDAFTGALLHSLLTQGGLRPATPEALRRALAFAVAAGALTCTVAGAQPPTAEEVTRMLEGLASPGR
ncbi:carbohydrate kinase family protein [Thermoactinospora rubra]|uniref:carbohydrate kinase family protein n=1 Tax=Thermoactinospora rubra TaxID=1088767 RepID=UPI000A1195E7|nr:carbohydrate kinase [Thermoactinospora rubra]